MSFFGKRKNDEVRRLSPWLMLVVGFLLGAALMFLFRQPVYQTVTYLSPDGLDMTATSIIAGATATMMSLTRQAP
jgi:hypothetical protein